MVRGVDGQEVGGTSPIGEGDRVDVEDRTARVRRLYDRTAAAYDRWIVPVERALLGGGRAWACRPAVGRVLEVAIGTGRNLAAYPEGLRVTGVDLSPEMLDRARVRAAALGRPVDLRVADAQALPFPDDTFDTVVCTLGLCSIPDDRRAVREMARVLRPGGSLRLLEHVRSPLRPVRIGQELVEPLFLAAAQDHLLREPADAVECAGLEIEELHRAKLGLVERLSARAPHR